MKKTVTVSLLFLLILFAIAPLTGCRLAPPQGREPFGETTYSKQETEAMFQKTVAHLDMEQFRNSAYHLSYSDDSHEIDFYQSRHYTVADARMGSNQEYLWYENTLYLNDDGKLHWRPCQWDEVQPEELKTSAGALALKLLARSDGDITFKRIPMAGDSPYLLKAEYPISSVKRGAEKIYPDLMIRMDESKKITSFSVSFSRPPAFSKDGTVINDGDFFSLAYYLDDPEDAFLQAERRIWMFGEEFGLTDEVVPALSTETEKRAWCKNIISQMDFKGLKSQGVPDDSIVFPSPF